MSLFATVKKKEAEPKEKLCCKIENVKVLGLGCATCHKQLENAQKAVKNLGLDLEVEYVTDLEKITAYGVMAMPGLVVNDKAVSAGKLLSESDVENLIKKIGG